MNPTEPDPTPPDAPNPWDVPPEEPENNSGPGVFDAGGTGDVLGTAADVGTGALELSGGAAEVADTAGGALEAAGGCLEGCGGCSLALLIALSAAAGTATALFR